MERETIGQPADIFPAPRRAAVSQNSLLPNVPNMISFVRLLSVPLTVWLLLHGFYVAAFWIFVAAGISDAVDGYIAKRFHLQSELGRYLDPLADKALLVSVFVTLGHVDLMETWLVILVVFRDALIICGALLGHLLQQKLAMRPTMISKINTSAQLLLAATVMLMAGDGISNAQATVILTYLVAASTFVSGAVYVVSWGQQAVELEPGE